MVTQEGVAARVGSRFSDIRDVVQVRLHKGEVVEILDRPPRGASREAGSRWRRHRASFAGSRPSTLIPTIPAMASESIIPTARGWSRPR